MVRENENISSLWNVTVIVGALGYFVDIYDLLLFSIIRVPSLKSLGLEDHELLSAGILLLNMQMSGLLVGGILWGIIGDKRGRLSVLFGSIFLYSIANILNAFVHSVSAYAALRFFAGIGLAGELGAAITLVSEIMTSKKRGYGTAIVASIGLSGAVCAALVGEALPWRTAYLIGGGLGLLLIFLRMRMLESGLFSQAKETHTRRGDFRSLFYPRERFFKYISCILIGVPIWFVIGVLVTLSPELSQALNVAGVVSAGKAVLFCYLGLSVGDLLSGILSQILKSRKKAVVIFLLGTLAIVFVYFFKTGLSVQMFYGLCFLLGVGTGYWAVFMMIAAESFGTNVRATVTTTVPNFVRGSVVPVTLLFQALSSRLGLIPSAMCVGILCFFVAFLALRYLPETYGKDLKYLELNDNLS